MIKSVKNRGNIKMKEIYDCDLGCPVQNTLQFISGKWKSVILYHIFKN